MDEFTPASASAHADTGLTKKPNKRSKRDAAGAGQEAGGDSRPIRTGTGIAAAVFGTLVLTLVGLIFANRWTRGDLFAFAPVQVVLGSCAFLAAITVDDDAEVRGAHSGGDRGIAG